MPQRFRAAALGFALVAALGLGACSNDKDLADASAFGEGPRPRAARRTSSSISATGFSSSRTPPT